MKSTLYMIVALILFSACNNIKDNTKNEPQTIKSYGAIDVFDPRIQVPESTKPLFDHWIRDTFVKLGHDGYYYMTGTVKHPDSISARRASPGINLWRSQDLIDWEDLGIVFDPKQQNNWHSTTDKKGFLTTWAVEIHYIKSAETYFLVACSPYKPHKGSYILRSVSGEAIGPYEDIEGNMESSIFKKIDGGLFEDEDGTTYFIGHSHWIAKMKPDMSDFAEPLRKIQEIPYENEPYIEGAYMVKHGEKYHLLQAIWSFKKPEGAYAYDIEKVGHIFKTHKEKDDARYAYDIVVASADSPYGPFGERYTVAIGAGHNNFFKTKEGDWYSTMFGNPRRSLLEKKFEARPAIFPLKYENGKFLPKKD